MLFLIRFLLIKLILIALMLLGIKVIIIIGNDNKIENEINRKISRNNFE